ncbi:peptidoglycan recognition protein family protein [Nocardia acididurans]|uniref:peptidoglycan recognition protein family protein n=1 Tax=Nocardia acididurans TaxID=2802282 RepID=UPI001E434EA6|nr:N-acetylmuramoyl-L-alanine amidase [Nocardia acididurans]
MSWRGDPVWLADVLRDAGLRVLEHDGWRDRGHGDFADIRGVLCHHTAGGGRNDWRIVQNGRPDLPGPLAQLVLEKDGTYRVIAAGVCWHAGRGSWPGWPTNNANYHTIGIEAVSRGDGSDWTPAQLDAYKRGCAAILRRIGRTASDCVAHREYSHEGKIDPAGIDMDEFRAEVQALIDGEDAPMSAAEVKQIQDFITGFCGPIGSDVKDIREQLCGLNERDANQYGGWPQLGGRTVVDALAEVLSRLEKLEA